MPSSSSGLSLTRALTACADELAALSGRCGRLQGALAPGLAGAAAIEEAQGLDLVTQSLEALATYLETLARGLPADWTVDAQAAAADLPLAELARRLLGQAPEAADSGELDLFGAVP
jgi:hypothetical protein